MGAVVDYDVPSNGDGHEAEKGGLILRLKSRSLGMVPLIRGRKNGDIDGDDWQKGDGMWLKVLIREGMRELGQFDEGPQAQHLAEEVV